jgi:hypothetical protein
VSQGIDQNIVMHMPNINDYKQRLSSLSKELQKTVLTGKISSLEVAETLFEFMEKTQIEFSHIQEDLIKNLIEENIKKLTGQVASRAQVVVDVLVRNLFERTADVGFLATDDDIIAFLKGSTHSTASKEFMKTRLREYVTKYSVYEDIILLNPKGEVVINLDENNTVTYSNDSIIEDTLSGNAEFCEALRHSDLQAKKEKSLLYTAKISSETETLGALCLCFKIDDEMAMIFERLAFLGMHFALLDSNGTILSTNKKTATLSIHVNKYLDGTLYTADAVSCIAKSKGYQGYMGQDWFGYASAYYKASFKNTAVTFPITIQELEETEVISKKLKEIKVRSEDIVDDLSDVVVNGEIIASKRRSYSLNPVLDNIRKVSESINENIKQSIQNIYVTVSQSHINALNFKAALCLDIMDRNLYERANDCRWWALTTSFRTMLADHNSMDTEKMTSILRYINSLYTVYTNLFIYDTTGAIIAVSDDTQSSIIGSQVSGKAYSKALSSADSQAYFVTNFASTPLYGDQRTYVYNASITNFDHKTVGGIGIVFDSTPQFEAILDDVLDASNQTGLFCEKDGTIIATSSGSAFKIGEVFEPIVAYAKNKAFDCFKIFNIHDKKYFIGMAKSLGYREYKREDGYSNDVYCAILAEI